MLAASNTLGSTLKFRAQRWIVSVCQSCEWLPPCRVEHTLSRTLGLESDRSGQPLGPRAPLHSVIVCAASDHVRRGVDASDGAARATTTTGLALHEHGAAAISRGAHLAGLELPLRPL